MKKTKVMPRAEAEHDTMRPEYDFTGGVRGKHAAVVRQGYTQVVQHADCSQEITEIPPRTGSIVLAPDVQAYFPDAEAVNTALRGLIALRPRRPKRQAAS